jgi:hypothetical protein
VTKIGHDECAAVFSVVEHYILDFFMSFEELKILNILHQEELFFHIHHGNYYQIIFVFFGHDEMVTQISNQDNPTILLEQIEIVGLS